MFEDLYQVDLLILPENLKFSKYPLLDSELLKLSW